MNRLRPARMRGKKGFTIVELLIAASIMALLMTVFYRIFSQVLRTFERVTIVELDRRVRLVFEWIRNDIRKACTRGSVLPTSPPGTKFYKFIVEDPLTEAYGTPVDMFGERDYVHGQTLRFFKFNRQPTPGIPPIGSMIKYSFAGMMEGDKLMDCVVRQETDESFNVSTRIVASFPHDDNDPVNNSFLYFVMFSVDEITPDMIRSGLAKPEELATGGRTYIRIYFRAVQKGKQRTEVVELVTVVDPRQINNYEKETDWKQNSSSKLIIGFDLLPKAGS